MYTYLTNRSLVQICSASLALLCLTIGSSWAAPADDISRAVLASGAASVDAATPAQFIGAYSSVLTRVKQVRHPIYVSSGITLRPDLAAQVTVATLRARGIEPKDYSKDSCNWVDPIIRAAIAAAPNARDAIVRAALEAEPYARECILAAAGGDGTQHAFFRPPGVDAGNINSTAIGTINPGNFQGQIVPVSPVLP